jgi:hypothetical protein
MKRGLPRTIIIVCKFKNRWCQFLKSVCQFPKIFGIYHPNPIFRTHHQIKSKIKDLNSNLHKIQKDLRLFLKTGRNYPQWRIKKMFNRHPSVKIKTMVLISQKIVSMTFLWKVIIETEWHQTKNTQLWSTSQKPSTGIFTIPPTRRFSPGKLSSRGLIISQ